MSFDTANTSPFDIYESDISFILGKMGVKKGGGDYGEKRNRKTKRIKPSWAKLSWVSFRYLYPLNYSYSHER